MSVQMTPRPVPAATSPAELAARFRDPDAATFGPVPIWWWSGARLTAERLRWQMDALLSQGVAQAVILNLAPTGPLYGCLADDPPFMTEEWWAIFLGACDDAAERGFRFWPYDQIGFSGANLQGRLVTARPEWAGQALRRLRVDLSTAGPDGRTVTIPRGARALGGYLVSADGLTASAVACVDGTVQVDASEGMLTVAFAQTRGFDYLNPEASAGLMDVVHGEFARRAGRWFGTVIPGFFQDELPAMPTWSDGFQSSFQQTYGYDLGPLIGVLWGDPIPDADPSSRAAAAIRRDFQEHRAVLAQAATFGPLQAWFDAHGLMCGFDQQSPAREGDPAGATRLYGNYLELHGAYGAPGSDHWGDSKIHSSLAHVGGKPRTWLEAFHSSGWGGTLEETYDWLAPFFRRGATLYSPHAVYYSTVGAWWEWAPPSTCWRQPYWAQYHLLAGAVARMSELLTTGEHVADTLLLFPTSMMQSAVTLDGGLADVDADAASRIYHELNGTSAWYAERPGLLDRSGHDYDIIDEVLLASATVDGTGLRVAAETYQNVVIPGAAVLRADVAGVLATFAASGGRVIVVGPPPRWFPPSDVHPDGGQRLSHLLSSGAIERVGTPEEVSALLTHGPVRIDADVPHLLRRVGDTWVICLFAHDERSGTVQPIVSSAGSGLDWITTTWDAYWDEITAHGYRFVPLGHRVASVKVTGSGAIEAQQWDPASGRRLRIAIERDADGAIEMRVPFDHGTMTVLVLGRDLPEPDDTALGAPIGAPRPVADDGWTLEARSLLDNDRGDLADARRTGILPIEVWTFEHAEGDGAQRVRHGPVTATYGPFATVIGPVATSTTKPWAANHATGDWSEAKWSLSRGIEKDPVHRDILGPKGYVPEEFLAWPLVQTGEWVAVRTALDVPNIGEPLVLALGANARKYLVLDGIETVLMGDGYLSTIPLGTGAHDLELWLQAERPEPIRAAFAVIRDLDAYRRPEWIEPEVQSPGQSHWVVSVDLAIDSVPVDARVLVGSEQPCTISINDVELGRQSDFDPYADRRFGRMHPYDLRAHLRPGRNTLRLSSLEGLRRPAVLIDSTPAQAGGLGVMSGVGGWSGLRDGTPTPIRLRTQQWQDPRFVCLTAKPHPLPRAAWLERPVIDGAVLDIVPRAFRGPVPSQHLEFLLPIGTTSLVVPTGLEFQATIDDIACRSSDGLVELDRPATVGQRMRLTFHPDDGRRAGALLDAAVQVHTTAVVGPLLDWNDLGLGGLGGEVEYSIRSQRPGADPDLRHVLDLGSVRGSVSVRIDGMDVGELAWSPYRIDITDVARRSNAPEMLVQVIVRNTLAGYMTSASPTPAVFAGQTKAGLLGPVVIRTHAAIDPGAVAP
jgi:hypothetical protein